MPQQLSSLPLLPGLGLAAVLFAPVGANAQDRKLTWDNAPAPARKLYLTEEEFRELLPEKKQPQAGYCPVECSHSLNGKQPNGRPVIDGFWQVDRKTAKVDHAYVPGNLGPGYKNPYWCHVTAVYRYAPPPELQPRPEIVDRPLCRLDMTVFASINAPYSAHKVREWKEKDAKSRMEDVRNPRSEHVKYQYFPDLGLGLDRNDMFVVLSKNVQTCSIHVKLNDVKQSIAVDLNLSLNHGAVSQAQAIAIARESAAIIARKAFGARTKLDKAERPGEVGLVESWITDSLGKTPEEDRRADRVALGKKFHIVCSYKLPKEFDEISIGYTFTPSQDAVAASRDRCQRVKDDSIWWKPLNPSGYRAVDIGLIYSKPDKNDADGTRVKVRKTTDGTLVVSFLVDTSDPEVPYTVGPGAWEYALQMKALKRGGPNESDREFEVSTSKVTVKIADDPDFTAKALKPPAKQP